MNENGESERVLKRGDNGKGDGKDLLMGDRQTDVVGKMWGG